MYKIIKAAKFRMRFTILMYDWLHQ